MVRRVALLISFMAFITACNTTDHEGYTRWKESVHYKLLELGDEDKRLTEKAYVSLEVSLKREDGSLIATKDIRRVRFPVDHWPKAVRAILNKRAEGDHFSILGNNAELETDAWFDPVPVGAPTAMVELDVLVSEVLSDEELRQSNADERARKDRDLMGLKEMEEVLDSLSLTEDNLWQGIYWRKLHTGTGARVASGLQAKVHYRTYLPGGTLIDDTYKTEAFEYPIGKPDQVLEGFAVALSGMRVGDMVQCVFPSELAYGSKGSSSGIVPPYSCLIYEIELLQLR